MKTKLCSFFFLFIFLFCGKTEAQNILHYPKAAKACYIASPTGCERRLSSVLGRTVIRMQEDCKIHCYLWSPDGLIDYNDITIKLTYSSPNATETANLLVSHLIAMIPGTTGFYESSSMATIDLDTPSTTNRPVTDTVVREVRRAVPSLALCASGECDGYRAKIVIRADTDWTGSDIIDLWDVDEYWDQSD